MKIIVFIINLICKKKSGRNPFEAPISEGIKEVFVEMGYHMNEKHNEN